MTTPLLPIGSWNDERIEILRKAWTEGASATQIARQLGGVTRNAVIGKLARLGLTSAQGGSRFMPARPRAVAEAKPTPRPAAPRAPRPAPAPREVSSQPAAVPRALAPARAPETAFVPAPGPSDGVGVMQIAYGQCRWPITTPPAGEMHTLRFCGAALSSAELEDNCVYCATHRAIAYQPRVTSARREKRELDRLASLADGRRSRGA